MQIYELKDRDGFYAGWIAVPGGRDSLMQGYGRSPERRGGCYELTHLGTVSDKCDSISDFNWAMVSIGLTLPKGHPLRTCADKANKEGI